jgi:hypothetical protein
VEKWKREDEKKADYMCVCLLVCVRELCLSLFSVVVDTQRKETQTTHTSPTHSYANPLRLCLRERAQDASCEKEAKKKKKIEIDVTTTQKKKRQPHNNNQQAMPAALHREALLLF